MFAEDAEVASKVLNIAAFVDRNGKGAFLCASVPVFRVHIYVQRLVQAGLKVGVVAQSEKAAVKAAGNSKSDLFERKLQAVYTKATVDAGIDLGSITGQTLSQRGATPESDPDARSLSNYLVTIAEAAAEDGRVECGFFALDPGTGRMIYESFEHDTVRSQLERCLICLPPAELVVADACHPTTMKLLKALCDRGGDSESVVRTEIQPEIGAAEGYRLMEEYFHAQEGGDANAGFLKALPGVAVRALAHCLVYLKESRLEACFSCLRTNLKKFSEDCEMHLSPNTLRQLEILTNSDTGTEEGSLFWLLNRTQTRFGSRLLQRWIAHPLSEIAAINDRLDAIEALLGGGGEGPMSLLPPALAKVPDLEKQLARMLHKTATPKEFVEFLQSFLAVAGEVGRCSQGLAPGGAPKLLRTAFEGGADPDAVSVCRQQLQILDAAAAARNDKLAVFLSPEHVPAVREGRARVAGVEARLEECLREFRRALRQPALKYVSVQNQGHFLVELPVAFRGVPAGWEKVCGTKKVNRFRPPQVKALVQDLEYEKALLEIECEKTWSGHLDAMQAHYVGLQNAVSSVATLDVLVALASVSDAAGYVRPTFIARAEPGAQVWIDEGRHAILDAMLESGAVPNGAALDTAAQKAAVITGPNMGGKSVYVKSVALAAVMAQCGVYVPAKALRMTPLDAIWTRMGAEDSLARGQSTFQVELGEASVMLRAATPRTLLILDELGRGTSTHDGVAIAIATLDWLVRNPGKGLALFVTHYPEVARLAEASQGAIGNYHMGFLRDEGGPPGGAPDLTFLYQVRAGVCAKSFGLNVAALAAIPRSVVARAREVADRAEAKGSEPLPPTARARLEAIFN